MRISTGFLCQMSNTFPSFFFIAPTDRRIILCAPFSAIVLQGVSNFCPIGVVWFGREYLVFASISRIQNLEAQYYLFPREISVSLKNAVFWLGHIKRFLSCLLSQFMIDCSCRLRLEQDFQIVTLCSSIEFSGNRFPRSRCHSW